MIDAQPRQLKQRWHNLADPLLELLVELCSSAVEGANRCDEIAGEPHLQLLRAEAHAFGVM